MKKGLVLSGGGDKGAFQFGVMKRLWSDGYLPDAIYGTSVGSLNACGVSYRGIEYAESVWMGIKKKSDILSLNVFSLLWSSGIYDMRPLHRIVKKSISNLKPQIEIVATYVDLVDGSLHYKSSNEEPNMLPYIMASSCIPGIMEPIRGHLVDGGVREIAPLRKAIEDGCEDITVILCTPITDNPTHKDWMTLNPKFLSNALRATDLLQHEVFLNDIQKCIQYNDMDGKKEIKLTVYAPEYLVSSGLEFDPKKIRKAIEYGQIIKPWRE